MSSTPVWRTGALGPKEQIGPNVTLELRLNASRVAAIIAGASPGFSDEVETFAARVRALSAPHAKTRAMYNSIDVSSAPGRGSASAVLDRLLSIDDPGAKAVEYGHFTRDGRWVPGKHIVAQAAGMRWKPRKR